MGIVLRCLVEEILAVSQMVLGAAGRCGERRLDAFGIGHLECTIHLIGGDMVEAFAFILLWQAFPVQLGSLKERECAYDVGAGEGKGVFDAAVHMAFSSKVDDTVNLFILHELVEGIEVADVHPDKLVVRFVLDVLEVGEIACVCQLVEVDDVVLGILVHEEANNVAANESGTACNNEI